jgi:tRNA (cytidine/uridine-2'-O-)-methyltransferase
VFAVTTKAVQHYDVPLYLENDVFVFGPESRGLPLDVIETFPFEQRIRIPMHTTARSLNLANAVSVVVYEAWRQLAFRSGS